MKLKSPEHRVRETTTLKEKLDALGLPLDDPDVRRLYDELERYARTGDSFSDRIRLKNLGYVALVKLSKQEHIPCDITLRKAT